MKRRFFICSVGRPGDGYDEENLNRCIEYGGHFMHQNTQHKGLFDAVSNNDVAILKYKYNFVAYGLVVRKDNSDNDILGDWNYAIYVDKWIFFDEKQKERGVSRNGVQEAVINGDQFATVKEIKPSFALKKMEEIKDSELLKSIKQEFEMGTNVNDIFNLLKANHNLILTGAPGTGKTYLAKQIAQQMIFGETKDKMTPAEEKQFNEQCGFVQFHPSYDYTDFVEGLRPLQDESGAVGFERKDGVFKEFCARAITQTMNESDNFDEVWDKLISDIRINLSNKKLTKIGNWEYGLSTKDSLKYSSVNTPSQYSFTITKKNIRDTYCEKQARPSGAFQKDMHDIVQYLKQTYKLTDKPKQAENIKKEDKTQLYVFIIDEINRGEMSKIFGELFFSIDPGYRGEKGKVQTQYQNMVEDCDVFKNGFFVPENVYIIGTMNDIDRSVESMDFAFRRRFAFKEITAKETQNMLEKEESWKDEKGNPAKPDTDNITKIKNRMDNLNNVIWNEKTKSGIEGLSSAYHIGASYFLKLANYRNNGTYNDISFKDLWDYHLEGLLREYMRGMQDVDNLIEKLRTAYNNESAPNN